MAERPVQSRGRLVAFEGIDGCGKSTQASAVAELVGALLTHEPGATALGARLRELLLTPGDSTMSARTEALLMAADRAEHVTQVIAPALEAGEWVVTDRFSASTIAYQGYGRGLDLDMLRSLVDWAAAGVTPDLSVLVDVPVDVAAARLSRLGRPADRDRLERLGRDFAARVREGFVAQAEADPEGWVMVDGTADVATVTGHIVAVVRERLGRPPASDR